MKAVVMQDAALKVEDLADPEPGSGEALRMPSRLRVIRKAKSRS